MAQWNAAEPSPRVIDPPVRRHFINSLPPHKRATALIRGYIETRVGCSDKAESAACRSFLKAYHGIVADGNELGIELAIMRGERMSVQFFFNIHGLGPVVWLPVLIMASNDHTANIMRETGPDRLAIDPRTATVNSGDEPSRKGFPPKQKALLIPGKRF